MLDISQQFLIIGFQRGICRYSFSEYKFDEHLVNACAHPL